MGCSFLKISALFPVVLLALAPAVLIGQSLPEFKASYLYGGPGHQRAFGLARYGPHLYLSGYGDPYPPAPWVGLVVKVNAADGSILWTSPQPDQALLYSVATDGTTVFSAGSAYPPACGASDGVGGTEGKSLFAIFRVSDGARTFCTSHNYYPYRGWEEYYSIARANGFNYAVGGPEEWGWGGHHYLVARYDGSGNRLNYVTDPSTFSSGWGAAADSSGVYVAGFRRDGSWHGLPELPFVVSVHPTTLSEQWRATIDAGASGARARFLGVAAAGGSVYAVGYWQRSDGNIDYLAAKFLAANGSLLWHKVFGSTGADLLRDVAVAGGRLFAAGQSATAANGQDAVLVELNPSDGSLLNSSSFGGSRDETIYRMTADATDLWLAGYSDSFATPEGNQAGQNDMLLLHYSLIIPVQIDIKPGSFPNSINLGSQGTVPVAIFSTPTFDARTVDPLSITLANATVARKGKGTPMASFQDVNQDGLLDLVVHVETQALQLAVGDTVAVLEGRTFDGRRIRGSDTVRVVP